MFMYFTGVIYSVAARARGEYNGIMRRFSNFNGSFFHYYLSEARTT